jgi:hypothetical protein
VNRVGRAWACSVLVVASLTVACATALAQQSARLTAAFEPGRLGAPSTVFVAFRIVSTPPSAQVPITNVTLQLPEEMGIATSGLGLENCLAVRLDALGPEGCPANALMGRGAATAEIPIAGETVSETARVELFSAPVTEGHLGLLVYVSAESPVFAQLIFPASIIPAVSPFSEGIDTKVPLVPSLPGAPDVAVTRFHMTIGATRSGRGHFVYYRRRHGRRAAYEPSGLLLPPSCPRGGFPFQADFGFADGSSTTAKTTVACPRRRGHAR